MRLKDRILSWSLFALLGSVALCYGAATDYKVTDDGTVYSYDLITKGPWIDARAYATLELANAAAAAAGKTLLIASNWTLTANTTLTSSVMRIPGGSFTKASVCTLTFKNNFVNPDNGRAFIGFSAGDVTFSGGAEVWPEWWGAVPERRDADVMAINTTAFTSAIRAAKVINVSRGHWYINGEINGGASQLLLTIKGAGRGISIVNQQTAATNIFNFPYLGSSVFSGLSFYHGAKAITFNTQNVDTTIITIKDSQFVHQTNMALEAQSGSNSTEFNVERCHFDGSYTFVKSYTDYTNILHCWASVKSTQDVFENRGGVMTIKGLIGTTSNGVLGSGTWVNNYGSQVYLTQNRFGADADSIGRTILTQNAPAATNNTVVIRESNIISTTDYYYKFFTLPETLIIKNNQYYGLGNWKGIWIDDTLAAGSDGYMKRGRWEIEEALLLPFTQNARDAEDLAAGFYAKRKNDHVGKFSNSLLCGDLMYSFLINAAMPESAKTGITTSDAATYEFLGAATTRQLTATAANARYAGNREDTVSRALVIPNVYTYVFDFYVSTTSPIQAHFLVNGNHKWEWLHNGSNIINIVAQPVYANGPGTQSWYFELVDIPNAAVIRFGRFRVFRGAHNIDTVNLVFHDLSSVIPKSDANHYYYNGDRVEYSNPTAGGYIGQVITTSGVNGSEVWKRYGAIAPP
jgi:hypothetical protein